MLRLSTKICQQNVPGFVLPSAESQVRSLRKLEPEEQVEVWLRAIEQTNGKIPTARIINKLVKEKKEMETPTKYKITQNLKKGDLVRVSSRSNPDIKKYHQCLGIVEEVHEHSIKVKVWETTLEFVPAYDVSKEDGKSHDIEFLHKIFAVAQHYDADPGVKLLLNHLTKKSPLGVSYGEEIMLNALIANMQ